MQLLSGLFDTGGVFDPASVNGPLNPVKVKKLKAALQKCVQHVNTLQKLLACEGKKREAFLRRMFSKYNGARFIVNFFVKLTIKRDDTSDAKSLGIMTLSRIESATT